MTPITAGMTPAQFNTAMNANIASVGFTGRAVDFTTLMLGHEIKTAFALDSLGTLNFGRDANFISNLNNTFNNISLADKVIAGAVDVKTFGATGDGNTDDEADINIAVTAGNIIIQNGTFKISASIKIPSNRTIYLFNCKIVMADASYDNFFRNSDMIGGNSNIYIVGLGNVELNGNIAGNNDNYATYGPKNPLGGPYGGTIYRYNAMIFCNVDGFEVSGLHLYDIPHWGFYIQRSRNGKYHDIYHNCNTIIENQDCVDCCHGTHDIEIYNIAANVVKDDFSAIAVSDFSDMGYTGIPNWNVGDVYNIYYHDIDIYDMRLGSPAAYLAGDGGKIYNIRYENIRIRNGGTIFFSSYGSSIYNVAPVKTDIKDITMNNIRFDTMQTGGGVPRNYVFYFGLDMMNFAATNITNNTGKPIYTITDGADVSDNVKINGVQVT
jgi:hypothetical protein